MNLCETFAISIDSHTSLVWTLKLFDIFLTKSPELSGQSGLLFRFNYWSRVFALVWLLVQAARRRVSQGSARAGRMPVRPHLSSPTNLRIVVAAERMRSSTFPRLLSYYCEYYLCCHATFQQCKEFAKP